MRKINKDLSSYLETALWSSVDYDNNDQPLDQDFNFDDIPDSELAKAQRDVNAFIEQAGPLLDEYDTARAMHDFWLTRNHHGAGFWDGDYSDEIGKKLTELSHKFGEVTLYVGDDKKLYFDRG